MSNTVVSMLFFPFCLVSSFSAVERLNKLDMSAFTKGNLLHLTFITEDGYLGF